MPFVFLIAGTRSWFALRRRSAGQFAVERFRRLFAPYVASCILLWPIMLYFEWRYLAVTAAWYGPFWQFVLIHRAGFSPTWFGDVAFHLWFLGFLFCSSQLGLPLFFWLIGNSGQAILAWLAGVLRMTRRAPGVHPSTPVGTAWTPAVISRGARLG
jgi:hypothetical protein